MIFHTSSSPYMNPDQCLEINHKVVVDDSDIAIMPLKEIESYFPNLPRGFFRSSIIQGHHDDDQQTLYLVTDQEIGESDGS